MPLPSVTIPVPKGPAREGAGRAVRAGALHVNVAAQALQREAAEGVVRIVDDQRAVGLTGRVGGADQRAAAADQTRRG